MKNLVLDVNVVLDLWFNRVPEEDQLAIAGLLADAHTNTYQCWVSSSSLSVLEYVARKELEKTGMPPSDATQATRALLEELMHNAHLLSNFSFHQAEAMKLSNDLEDAQIVLAASSLQGATAIVTNEKRFQTGGKIEQVTPKEADAWLQTIGSDKAIDFIDLKSQQDGIRPALENNIHRVLHHGQYIMGPEVRELEGKLEIYTDVKHCITVASGTEALLISLMALGLKQGDEVITTPFTFVATVEAIVLLGATPVFVDIQSDTCNIDTTLIEAAITEKTKAIIPVSLYGQVADMDEINAIAARHGNIPVIEDAAQSFGATYKGRKTCGLSTIGCTSFFPSKPLGCYGDGGAIFTNDDALAKIMREIRVHGQERRYYHTRIGVGGRMDTLQCAVVLAKLERFDWEIEQRIAAGALFMSLFSSVTSVTLPVIRPDRSSVWGQFTIQVNNRDVVLENLKLAGIPTAVHYPVPLHRQPAYQISCRIAGALKKSDFVASRVVSLPMHPYLKKTDIQRVVDAFSGISW